MLMYSVLLAIDVACSFEYCSAMNVLIDVMVVT